MNEAGQNNNYPNESGADQLDSNEAGEGTSDLGNREFTGADLKRLRVLGLFKAYMEMLNNIPDLFKYSTQFQILPLNLCKNYLGTY